ncbi:hypothetical protein M8C21_014378 [Ambrosia artemisiifolia]|uniref:Uncharacterized protein n=1 Tax=Ambrosia artemisiifolia TaxID=4212 RepID=A0AAD5CUW4_AMBAR|nr:hypothetical protein M8C21_014378 [Ambrosia artemisiifolia]
MLVSAKKKNPLAWDCALRISHGLAYHRLLPFPLLPSPSFSAVPSYVLIRFRSATGTQVRFFFCQ